MLKAIRISSSILRNFSSVQQLVAQPKKLQKKLNVSKSIRWLHKDVKVGKKKGQAFLTEEDLEILAHKSVSSTLGNSSLDSLQNFCTAFINRLGPESFQTFISKHEFTVTKLTYLPHYKAYLKSCFKFFKNDIHLLKLMSFCNFRQLNSDTIPKLIGEDTFDNEHKIEHQSHYYLKMMPKPQWVFDDYLNTCKVSMMAGNNLFPKYLSDSDIPETDIDNKPLPVSFTRKTQNKKPVIDRIITFMQTASQENTNSNWIYIQVDMAKDEMLNKKNIEKTLERIGITSIKDMKLFHNKPGGKHDDILDIDNTLNKIDISLCKEMDVNKVSELAKNSRSSVLKLAANEDEVLTGELSTNSSELDRDTKRFNDMIKFASRQAPKSKAYGFVELDNHTHKEQSLKEVFRLFGIEMEKALLVLEDADIKKTLRVSNLPWNLDPSAFVNWLNEVSRKANLNMKFNFDPQFKGFLSDASYVFVTANSFTEALKLFEAINTYDYNGRKVFAEFRRGCGRYISGNLNEDYYSAASEEREKAHIDRRTKLKEAWVKRHSSE
ncbi:hypothetical protein SteCoe_19743 [Stentor coeruleus]|uniref:Uncharacterized protein n=1 Tax=Stentor coeruleus TaxID=5963 RepID=A0A1R2BU39_9CILI|nr:hypothetical protein SteCoe_19743 [Stentor coeruleus]